MTVNGRDNDNRTAKTPSDNNGHDNSHNLGWRLELVCDNHNNGAA